MKSSLQPNVAPLPLAIPQQQLPVIKPHHSDLQQATPPSPTSDSSDELPSVDKVLKLTKPARKVAGSRRAGTASAKGKEKATGKRKAPLPPHVEAKRMKGRSIGASNYTDEDYELLLDVAAEVLPLAGLGWEAVADVYNERAELAGRPLRSAKSIEAKYKQVNVLYLFSFSMLNKNSSGYARQNRLGVQSAHGT